MAKLHKELALSILNYSSKDKEEIGNKIVFALGGDPKKSVIGLPTRRGNSDGGIDGRIPILIEVEIDAKRNGRILSIKNNEMIIESEAAFCIKLQNKNFSRDQLGAFVEDMRRESIYDGIIVTVLPLSQDAKVRFEEYNKHSELYLRHILLEDLIAKNVYIDFKLVNGGSFQENFSSALKEFIREN